MRLLTEASFVEEFDTVVDEITDKYVRGEFEGDELKRIEQYFLKARDRKLKARFASTLVKHASETRRVEPAPVKPLTLIDRLLTFFSSQSMAFKFASTAAVLVLVVATVYLVSRGPAGPQMLAQIELSMSEPDRAEGAERKSLQLAGGQDGARIVLNLPADVKPYQSYRAELMTRDGVKTTLEVTEHNSRTVTAVAPASLLRRGSYAIQLTGIKPDGTPEHLPGNYYFNVR